MISNFSIFNSLTDEQKARLTANCHRETFEKDEIIFKQGDSGCSLYLIDTGKVEISVFSYFVSKKIVAVLSDKDFFGEMSILNRKRRRSASAISLERTHVIVVPESEVEALMDQQPSLAMSMLRILSKRLEDTNTRNFMLELWKFLTSDRSIEKLLQAAVYTAEDAYGCYSEIILDPVACENYYHLLFSEEMISQLKKKTEEEISKVKVVFLKDQVKIQDSIPPKNDELTVFSQSLVIEEKNLGYFQIFAKKENFEKNGSEVLESFAHQVAEAVEMEIGKSKLKIMENRIKGIFETIADGLLVLDDKGLPLLSNKAFKDMFFPPDCPNNDALNAILPSLYQSGKDSGNQELVLLKPHAQILSSNFITTCDAKGNKQETIISIRNVTGPKREEQKFLQLVSMLIRRIYNLYLPLVAISEPLRDKRFKRIRRMIKNFIYLIEIKSGPLRVQRMPTTIGEFMAEVMEKVVPVFERRRIKFVRNENPEIDKTGICVDSELLLEAFLSILAFHGRRLGFDSKAVFNEKIEGGVYSFGIETQRRNWRIPVGPEILDWQKCIEWFIAAENRAVLLELPFSRHIFESHKGKIEFFEENQIVKFVISVPVEEF
ncbi:MAG: cyclic nucleotide-binding domain-containing protein [Candidatus Riflebacteria bacterium]|nr:cyclic nucleotide-binding domain-containing protein [Candidatus Riflebacteria bacterium]